MRHEDDHWAGNRLALRTMARVFPVGDECRGQIMGVGEEPERRKYTQKPSAAFGGCRGEGESEGGAEQLRLSSLPNRLQLSQVSFWTSGTFTPPGFCSCCSRPVLPASECLLGFYPSRAAPVTTSLGPP